MARTALKRRSVHDFSDFYFFGGTVNYRIILLLYTRMICIEYIIAGDNLLRTAVLVLRRGLVRST